ncbi:hypothetical protein J437_LFUL017518, partial [Ladona fulva]
RVFKNENIEFYTYQVPSLRKLDFVVRDLPASTPVDVIKEALINEKIPVIEVEQIFTSRPTAKDIISSNPGPFKKRPCPLFKITLDHSVNKEKLTSLTHLIGLKIRVTDYMSTARAHEKLLQFPTQLREIAAAPIYLANVKKFPQTHPIAIYVKKNIRRTIRDEKYS